MPSKVRRGLGPRFRRSFLRGRILDLDGHLTEEGAAEGGEGEAEKEETDEGESGRGRRETVGSKG